MATWLDQEDVGVPPPPDAVPDPRWTQIREAYAYVESRRANGVEGAGWRVERTSLSDIVITMFQPAGRRALAAARVEAVT